MRKVLLACVALICGLSGYAANPVPPVVVWTDGYPVEGEGANDWDVCADLSIAPEDVKIVFAWVKVSKASIPYENEWPDTTLTVDVDQAYGTVGLTNLGNGWRYFIKIVVIAWDDSTYETDWVEVFTHGGGN